MADAALSCAEGAASARTVSVIVCAYTLDRWPDLVAAVKSLQGQSQLPDEIIVVSDHNDELFGRIRQTWPVSQGAAPRVVALENEEARGLSGARNTGVRCATGDIIAFLDDDAVAEPEWLAGLLAAYQDSGNVLGVGGAILPVWDGARPTWFPQEFDWVVGCTYKGMPERRSRQRNLIGANMSFRRELFDVAGDFQTDMGRIGTRPLGCEETELCIRGTQQMPGAYYLYEPSARAHHRVPAQRATWRYFVSRCYSEGLSKAQVADRVGAGDGLSTERGYATRTLPLGALRGFADAVTRRRPGGLGRAAAIILGLGITGAGYARGRLQGARNRTATVRTTGAVSHAPSKAA